jgi:anti-sigma B factor antagonist
MHKAALLNFFMETSRESASGLTQIEEQVSSAPKRGSGEQLQIKGNQAHEIGASRKKMLQGGTMKMTTSNRQSGGVTIVDITGRIVLGEESAALRELVRDLLNKGCKKILFNLGGVDYIDSAGLGHLVSALAIVRKQGGELKLLNLTNKVHNLMQITRLYTVFDIMEDETIAVKSFGQSLAA